jgi:hypothetical protein
MTRPSCVPKLAYVLAGLLGVGGCGGFSPDTSHLRITNVGRTPIVGLTVRFPEDRISFGDIPVGATTQYKDVPNGVYSYAAYTFELDGAVVHQLVIDWVGAKPMQGVALTYALDVNPQRPPFGIVQLVSVTRDD